MLTLEASTPGEEQKRNLREVEVVQSSCHKVLAGLDLGLASAYLL